MKYKELISPNPNNNIRNIRKKLSYQKRGKIVKTKVNLYSYIYIGWVENQVLNKIY